LRLCFSSLQMRRKKRENAVDEKEEKKRKVIEQQPPETDRKIKREEDTVQISIEPHSNC